MSATKSRLRRLVPAFAAALILAALGVSAAYAYLGLGLRAYVVETPSMGTYAPVGTLVISHPVGSEVVKVGQTILFNPSTNTAKTYFHRVTKIMPTGLSTAGDLTHEQDPWLLTQKDIIGVEVLHVANLGWLFKAAPVLILGALLLWVYVRFFAQRFWRVPTIFFGASAILSVANYIYHPFVQASLLDKSVQAGIATIRFVNTGILPLDVRVGKEASVVNQGELFVSHQQLVGKGSYSVSSLPHVEWWTLILFILICLTPSVIGFVYARLNRNADDNWYYVPLSAKKQAKVNLLINQSDQISVNGKMYPKYITEDYEVEPYWLEGVENLSMEQLQARLATTR